MVRPGQLQRIVLGLCVFAVSLRGVSFQAGRHLDFAAAYVSLAHQSQSLFQEGFEAGLEAWDVINYRDGLVIAPRPDHAAVGTACLLITKNPAVAETDTAWELRSHPLPVSPETHVRLRFRRRHNLALTAISGHGNLYHSWLEYRDGEGRTIGHTDIPFGDAVLDWRPVDVTAITPAGTASVLIRLGFDHPNLDENTFLALDDISLTVRSPGAPYETSGMALSRPLALPAAAGRTFAWKAALLPGSRLDFALRGAPDRAGGPGQWSAFVPLEEGTGTSPSVLGIPGELSSFPWLQYRVRWHNEAGKSPARLEWVELRSTDTTVREEGWTGIDELPPRLAGIDPTRAGTPDIVLHLTLEEKGTGLDPRTVRTWLDQEEIIPRQTTPNHFDVTPPRPLTPCMTFAGFDDWSIHNYRSNLRITPGKPRTEGGTASLCIRCPTGRGDTAFRLTSPPVSVQAGQLYRWSIWLRGTMDFRHVDHTYTKGLCWFDGSGKPLGNPLRLDLGSADPQWHKIQQTFRAPANAEFAVISLGWDNPNFTGNDTVEFADARLDGPHPPRPGTINMHHLRITAADFAGNHMSETCPILIRKPPASGHVSLRDDGVTLIDGKPFFPIGIYSVSKRKDNDFSFDHALKELHAAGFNTVHTYTTERSGDIAELYAAAAKYGMKLFLAPATGANSTSVRGALMTVAEECNEPALLAWYLADDTASYIAPETLELVHRAIHRIDPYHITVQADGCSAPGDDRYQRFINATDGFLPELYPIRNPSGNHVASVIQGMKNIQNAWKAAKRITPVWAIIQDFEGWGWARYPTDAEQRCMIYLAIIHGAQGITWYTYAYRDDKHGAPWHPDRWAYLKKMAGELAALQTVLTTRDPVGKATGTILDGPKVGDLQFPSLNLRLKKLGNEWTLLAANSAHESLRVTLRAPGLDGKVRVLFEDRTLPAKQGRLTDRFAPLAVHLYRWKAAPP